MKLGCSPRQVCIDDRSSNDAHVKARMSPSHFLQIEDLLIGWVPDDHFKRLGHCLHIEEIFFFLGFG